MVTREAGLIFQAGGLPAILSFISDNQSTTHKDILHSAMAVCVKYSLVCWLATTGHLCDDPMGGKRKYFLVMIKINILNLGCNVKILNSVAIIQQITEFIVFPTRWSANFVQNVSQQMRHYQSVWLHCPLSLITVITRFVLANWLIN